MTPDELDPADPLRIRAAQWFARMQSGEASAEEARACAAWRRADRAHDQAYRSVEFAWRASHYLPEQPLRAMLASSRAATGGSVQPARRRLVRAVATACAVVAAGVVALPLLQTAKPEYQAVYETSAGERRDIALPDGSVLNLNVNTQLKVAFFEDRRQVDLVAGQAFFAVRRDAARKFQVRSADTTVTVTGTRFDVRHDDARVAVESGSVSVATGPWWNRTERLLTAGQAVERAEDGSLTAVTAVRIENVTAWRQGKIVFEDTPLERAVQEMNRYLPRPATLDAPALRDYRVAGVFNADDPQAILATLPAVAPVQVRLRADGGARILPR